MNYEQELAFALQMAVQHDTDYDIREPWVYKCLALARVLGYEAGIRLDPDEPDWPVAVIELPNGQVSWHLPGHKTPWDGHSTEEKVERALNYADKVSAYER